MDNQKTVLINFSTDEHAHYNRSNDFYWGLGIITLAAVVLAFIFKDGLFGVLILIGAFMYGYSSWKKPNTVGVVITDKDITIGDDLYLITKIESFHVVDLKGEKELVLCVRRNYEPIVSVCVPDEIALDVKNALSSMIVEDEKLFPHIGRRFMARYKI